MEIHSILAITLAVIVTLSANGQTPFATDSGWSDFRCFTDAEIEKYRELYKIDDGRLDVNGEVTIVSDDYSLPSYVASILQRELFGIGAVQLWDFYAEAATFIAFITAANDKTFAFHWEILTKDFTPPEISKVMDYPESYISQTTWAIRDDVARNLEGQLVNDLGYECDLFLGQWRSFARDEVIAAMDNASLVVIPPRDDGTMPCTEWYGCMYGDSTWYPPHCDPIANDCMVLLQFLPEHDLELNRDLILNHNLSIVIKYMGSPRTHYGQSNFRTFYEGKYRVIFQLRSIDFLRSDGFEWNSIVLPAGEEINRNQRVLQLTSEIFHAMDFAAAHVLMAQHVRLEQSDIDWIHEEIFRATRNGTEDETKDIRMQAACEWMKSKEGAQKMEPWIVVGSNEKYGGPPCNTIKDHILKNVDGLSEADLWSIVWHNAEDEDHFQFTQEASGLFYGSLSAVYVKRNCIHDQKGENMALLVSGYCLSGCAVVLLIVVIVATIICREQSIIISSSIRLTAVLFLGVLCALSVFLFLEDDIVSHCIMRMYVTQIGATLMFGPLVVKIWKLSAIHENIKLLRTSEITEKTQMNRIAIVLVVIVGFLSILVLIFPMEIRRNIVDGERTKMCEWDGSAEKAYGGLILMEALGIFLVARTAWSIKSVNDVYNEHKWIGSTLLGAVLIIAGYLILGLLERSKTVIIYQSMFIGVLVILVISLLMIPKFRIIWQCKEYHPDSFEYNSQTFASSLLTKKDLKRMRSLLRNFGYHVIKKDNRGNVVESSVSGSAWSSVGKRMSNLWSKRYSSSSDLLKRSTSVSDVKLKVIR